MATTPMRPVIRHLRTALLLRDGAGLSDGQLLEGYVRCREETALAALVHRHGPMVWGVCRRVLGNYHDAEDAFQAAINPPYSVSPLGDGCAPPFPPSAVLFCTSVPFSRVSAPLDQMPPPAAACPLPPLWNASFAGAPLLP